MTKQHVQIHEVKPDTLSGCEVFMSTAYDKTYRLGSREHIFGDIVYITGSVYEGPVIIVGHSEHGHCLEVLVDNVVVPAHMERLIYIKPLKFLAGRIVSSKGIGNLKHCIQELVKISGGTWVPSSDEKAIEATNALVIVNQIDSGLKNHQLLYSELLEIGRNELGWL